MGTLTSVWQHSVVQLLVFLIIRCVLDAGKGNLNVKMGDMGIAIKYLISASNIAQC